MAAGAALQCQHHSAHALSMSVCKCVMLDSQAPATGCLSLCPHNVAVLVLLINFGCVCVKVWCWKSGLLAVPAHQRLMQDLDDWSAVKDFSYEYSGQNRLRSFMAMVLRGQPHHDHLQVSTTVHFLFVRSFIHSFLPSFLCSFVHSFTHSLLLLPQFSSWVPRSGFNPQVLQTAQCSLPMHVPHRMCPGCPHCSLNLASRRPRAPCLYSSSITYMTQQTAEQAASPCPAFAREGLSVIVPLMIRGVPPCFILTPLLVRIPA